MTLPDREKVIRGLEVCTSRPDNPYQCKRCPYKIGGRLCCYWEMLEDALALLKADEREEAAHD